LTAFHAAEHGPLSSALDTQDQGVGARALPESPAFGRLRAALAQRILIIDGAMGTMIQQYKLSESDYQGHSGPHAVALAGHAAQTLEKALESGIEVKGNNELLSLTQPGLIQEIHTQYLAAGADIIETNTFGATTIAQEDYRLAALVVEMNRASAQVACAARDQFSTPEHPRFVAGAIGPTPRTASISPDVNDPGARNTSFEALTQAYAEQARAANRKGLVRGAATACAGHEGPSG
jgi:5-methyltetrahydrofolate--homocysteine methyltransferase